MVVTDVFSVMAARHCKRAFLSRPVPREALSRVLEAASHAPSARNNQPWNVAVLSGRSRDALSDKLCAAFDRGVAPKHDFATRPEAIVPRDQRRAESAAKGLLDAKGIRREDEVARKAHHRANFLFYGAPIELVVHTSAGAVPASFLEIGFFLQNVMLGLVAEGLGSCPQFSVAGYASVVREHLGFGRDRIIVCGMAVGYPDEQAPENAFYPERAALEEYTQWFDEA